MCLPLGSTVSLRQAGNAPRIRRALAWISRGAYRRPRLALSSAAAVLAVGLVGATQLRLDADQLGMLPADRPSAVALQRYRVESGVGAHIVLVRSTDPVITRCFADALAARLGADPGMGLVATGDPVDFFRDRALYYISAHELATLRDQLRDVLDHQRSLRNPFIDWLGEPPSLDLPDVDPDLRDRYETADGLGSVVLIRPRQSPSDLAFAARLMGGVDVAAASVDLPGSDSVVVTQHGSYADNVRYHNQFRGDIAWATLLGLGLLLTLLLAALRPLRVGLIAVVPLAIGAAVPVAAAAFLLGGLNILSALAASVLLGLGIDYALHWLFELQELDNPNDEESVVQVTCDRGFPLLVSALTTAAAFLGLTLADNRGYREFGLVSGLGVMACWVATMVVLPALIRIVAIQSRRTVVRVPTRTLPPRLVVFGGTTLALVGASIGALDPGAFEYTLSSFLAEEPDAAVRSGKETLRTIFAHRFSPIVLIGPPDVLPKRDELEPVLEALHSTADEFVIVSSLDLVPDDQHARQGSLHQIEADLLELETLEPDENMRGQIGRGLVLARQPPFDIGQLPEWLRSMVDLRGPDQAVLIFTSLAMSDGRLAIPLRRALLPMARHGAALTGESMIFAELLEDMRISGALSLAVGALLSAAIVKLAYPSRLSVTRTLLPAFVGLLWTTSLLRVTGGQFGVFNMMLLPLLIGLGLDNNVHLVDALVRGDNPEDAVARLRRPLTLATATTLCGFAGFLASSNPGVRSVGHLGIVGFVAMLGSALVFLPALAARRSTKPFLRKA